MCCSRARMSACFACSASSEVLRSMVHSHDILRKAHGRGRVSGSRPTWGPATPEVQPSVGGAPRHPLRFAVTARAAGARVRGGLRLDLGEAAARERRRLLVPRHRRRVRLRERGERRGHRAQPAPRERAERASGGGISGTRWEFSTKPHVGLRGASFTIDAPCWPGRRWAMGCGAMSAPSRCREARALHRPTTRRY